MKSWSNSKISIALRKYKIMREEKDGYNKIKGELIDPAVFKKFMGTFHDQNQTELRIVPCVVPDDIRDYIK